MFEIFSYALNNVMTWKNTKLTKFFFCGGGVLGGCDFNNS